MLGDPVTVALLSAGVADEPCHRVIGEGDLAEVGSERQIHKSLPLPVALRCWSTIGRGLSATEYVSVNACSSARLPGSR